MAALAFEIEHGIDHVFEQPRSGNGAFLGHMAHQKSGDARSFGHQHQPHGGFAHLAHAARGRGDFRAEHGLDRVDHHDIGRLGFECREDVPQAGLGREKDRGLAEAESSLAARSASGVSSGHIVFEWVDEWWKANPDASNPDNTCVDGGTAWDQHDSCTSFLNFAYPDIEQQEEWWGVATTRLCNRCGQCN